MPRCSTCHRRLSAGAICPVDGERAPKLGGRAPRPADVEAVAVGQLLGAGGFAAVYRATLAGGKRAALKVAHSGSLAAAARLARERAALEVLAGSAAPAVLGAGETGDGRPYLVVESIAGAPLAQAMADRSEPMPMAEVAPLAEAISRALATAHRRGIAHGDLSPENILVEDIASGRLAGRPRVYLVDFGCAAGDALPGDPPRGAGTPEYAAPEVLRGEAAMPAADAYALAIILYELACLRPPFCGDAAALAHAHLSLSPPAPSQLAPVSPRFDELIARCLAKKPAERIDDVEALGREFAAACREPAAAPAPRPGRGRADPFVPAVIAAVDTAAPAPDVIAAASRHRGVVLGHTGDHYLCAVLADDADRPGPAGLALASALAALPGSVALHLARVRVRERAARPPLVVGDAVDRPDDWLPPESWSGVVATEAFARTQPASALAPSGWPGLYTLDDAAPAAPPPKLVGREGALEAAEASFQSCVSASAPSLVVFSGHPGAGRTRMIDEAIARARARCPELGVRVFDRGRERPGETARAATARAREGPVALVADDLDGESTEVYDALARAALDEPGARLWIVVAASPHSLARRPNFGAGARRVDRVPLDALAPADAALLAAAFLHPAEYVPSSTLRQIAAWAGGLPRALEEIARALKRDGVVRRRDRGDGFRLDTDRLAKLTDMSSAPWLAARELEGLPPELASLARRAAVLAPVTARELFAIQRVVSAGEPVADAGAGLAALAERGLFFRRGEHYHARSALLAAGLEALVGDDERDALHRAAFSSWRERAAAGPLPASGLEALARHALAAGAADEAAAALCALADDEAASFRFLDAERHYSAALARAGGGERMLRLHLGRGRVRYRIDRVSDALVDLREARKLAFRLGDRRAEIDALLEEATALDWASDFEGSARRVAEADALAGGVDDPVLEAKLLAARGRTCFRRNDAAEAARLLSRASDAAAAAADHDSRVIALLLAPLALLELGDVEGAKARFEEVIALCARAGDRLHLAAAYGNRTILWSAIKAPPEEGRADLRRARAIARELGHPGPERAPTFNLAEDLFWAGEDDEALELAERARSIARRLWPRPVAEDALLVARIAAASGDAERARAELSWIEREVPRAEWSDSVSIFVRATHYSLCREHRRAWESLAAEARTALSAEEHLEVLHAWMLAARAAGRRDEARQIATRARSLVGDVPIWRRRFERSPAG